MRPRAYAAEPLKVGFVYIFGVCFFAAFVEVVFSQFIDKLRKLISPVVTGTIICLMGLSLIKVAVTDMAGGLNSASAATLNSMPKITFAQNNGVIQLTGVASRHVALYIAAIMVLLGLFPVIGAVLLGMPKPVLGGATLIMFGTVAGIKILAEAGLHRRNMLIVGISLGLGIGVAVVPEVLLSLPKTLHLNFESSITVGALSAILLNIFLPEEPSAEEEEDYDFDPEAAMTTVRQTIEQAQPSTIGLADYSPTANPSASATANLK